MRIQAARIGRTSRKRFEEVKKTSPRADFDRLMSCAPTRATGSACETWPIEISDSAEIEADNIFLWIQRRNPEYAVRWYRGIPGCLRIPVGVALSLREPAQSVGRASPAVWRYR